MFLQFVTPMRIPQRFLPPMAALRIFEAASRHESFTSAAQELGLTQGAVSRQIQTLEILLGGTLFIRHGKTVQLTRAGTLYAKEIRLALKTISNATLGFRANPQGGTLNLAAQPTFATRWLTPKLHDFKSQHPDIVINIMTRTTPVALQHEGVDAAIYFGVPENDTHEFQLLMKETLIPVCSPAFKKQYEFHSYQQLLEAPLIHIVSRPDAWEQWFHQKEVPFEEVNGMLVDLIALATEAASAGLGIALLPTLFIQPELRRKELIPAIEGPVTSKEAYYLTWQSELDNYPPLVTFKNWLHEQIKISQSAAKL